MSKAYTIGITSTGRKEKCTVEGRPCKRHTGGHISPNKTNHPAFSKVAVTESVETEAVTVADYASHNTAPDPTIVYDFQNPYKGGDKNGTLIASIDPEEVRYMDMDELQYTLTQIAFGGNGKFFGKHVATYRTIERSKQRAIFEVTFSTYE